MLKESCASLISKNKSRKTVAKITFFVLGIGSLLWFLIRVIPKPSRAVYPCMRAAAPIMSGFVIYLLSLSGSVLAFRKATEHFRLLKYKTAILFGFVAIAAVLLIFGQNALTVRGASEKADSFTDLPNVPMGEAKGIYPGRVSWIMDKGSTNENCTNISGDYWYMDKNTNQIAVNTMLSNGLMNLTGRSTSAESWDALFKYFNYTKGKGWKGYTAGEKIVVKLNLTSNGNGGRTMKEGMNSTPQLVLALLQQLVDTLHISQSDITIGDPYRGFSNEYWDKCHTKYPNVHYFEGKGTDGREQTIISSGNVYFNSDGNFQSRLPKAYIDAAYLINMPCLKSHGSAGITIAAKNHQGSLIDSDQNATNQSMGALHYDYPDNAENKVMGIYRHIVDYMAHEKLGGNTLVYIVDAIWSGRDWFGTVEKWKMDPFNNDWTSSLFLSQDAVAIESVGFDFLYYEYANYKESHANVLFPTWTGVQDYIHQAADPANWPEGIQYDPNHANHSSPVGSLGVHEHWNDVAKKEYSKNLGINKGIELSVHPESLAENQMVHVSGITVPSSMTINENTSLVASLSPENALNKEIIWLSSDNTIATVDQNGLVHPIKSGNTTIKAITVDGNLTATSLITVDLNNSLQENKLTQCKVYPNPVIDKVTFSYNLSENALVRAEIYSTEGKLILSSSVKNQLTGRNSLTFDLSEYSISNGIYLCKITASGKSTFTFTARMIVGNN